MIRGLGAGAQRLEVQLGSDISHAALAMQVKTSLVFGKKKLFDIWRLLAIVAPKSSVVLARWRPPSSLSHMPTSDLRTLRSGVEASASPAQAPTKSGIRGHMMAFEAAWKAFEVARGAFGAARGTVSNDN